MGLRIHRVLVDPQQTHRSTLEVGTLTTIPVIMASGCVGFMVAAMLKTAGKEDDRMLDEVLAYTEKEELYAKRKAELQKLRVELQKLRADLANEYAKNAELSAKRAELYAQLARYNEVHPEETSADR